MNAMQVLKGTVSFLKIARDPNQLNQVFHLADSVADTKVLEAMAAGFRATEEGARALAEKPRLGKVDLAELQKLPEGTLGRAYADLMISQGLSPEALPNLAGQSDAEYVRAHLYETHDLWHTLTGMGTDVAGELGLQAFYLAQYFGPLAPTILAAGLLNTALFARDDYTRRMDAIARGWSLGRKARPLFGADWKALLSAPIAEVRERFQIGGTADEARAA